MASTGPSTESGGSTTVTPGAIGKPAVGDRVAPIGLEPEWGDQPLDGPADLARVQMEVGANESARTLDPDRTGTVHQHVGDRRILEQVLERAEADEIDRHPPSPLDGL